MTQFNYLGTQLEVEKTTIADETAFIEEFKALKTFADIDAYIDSNYNNTPKRKAYIKFLTKIVHILWVQHNG